MTQEGGEMTLKNNNKRTIYLIITMLAVPVSFLLIGGDQISSRATMSLFLASLAGILNSFTSTRVQKIMRYVPLTTVLGAALCFQNFEMFVKVHRLGRSLTPADFFPLSVDAAYLFSRRLSILILRATKSAPAATDATTTTKDKPTAKH